MRVLYFIQTFKNLPQIARLVRTIKASSPLSIVVISHNPETFTIDPATFQDLDDVYVTYVTNIARGDYSLMQAYLDGITWIRAHNIQFDWTINITGQCYPVRPLAQFEHMLATTPYDAFMEYYDAYEPSELNPWPKYETVGRYEYQYRWKVTTRELPVNLRRALSIPRRIINNIQPAIRVDTSYGLQFGLRSSSIPFGRHFKLYGGNTFKTLSRRAADYLYDFAQERKDIITYFTNTLLPEEVLPQTILVNNPDLKVSPDDLYYVNWAGSRFGRPQILTSSDYDDIVAKGSFFARKFDIAQDSNVLDLFDALLFEKGHTPALELS